MVKMQSNGQGAIWGSVKRCSGPYLQHSLAAKRHGQDFAHAVKRCSGPYLQHSLAAKRHGQDFAHAQLVDSQWVKGKNKQSRPFLDG